MPFFESFKEVQIRPETVQVIVHCIEAKTSAANLFRFPNIVTFISVSVGASACDHQGWDWEHIPGDHNHHHNPVSSFFHKLHFKQVCKPLFINGAIFSSKSIISQSLRKDKLFTMVKAYGSEFKRTLVYDRIKEDLRIFCANNTIDDVYNVKFLDIVEQVKANVKTSISRLGEVVTCL